MKRLTLILAAALLIALVWFLRPRHETSDVPPPTMSVATSSPAVAQSKMENPKSKIPAALPALTEISHLADALNSPAADIRADLNILKEALANFRSNFPRDGNPVGNNAEITAALSGRNKLRYAVIPPNHPAINRAGELCDRWGTPFFFHAESANTMGIRSAGPDKKMWTDDDIATGP